jgi:putative Mn2+ efflux pump MntP
MTTYISGGNIERIMTFIDILLTAFSLSLDAVAIAVAASTLHHVTLRQAIKIAFFFGAFQLFMPLIGWSLGFGFKDALEAYGKMIGFVLLLGVGVNMLRETFKKETPEDVDHERHLAETKILTIMAVATSIDALVVGITFNFVTVNISLAVLIIGAVTFLLSLLGVYIGKKFKHLVGRQIEVVGAFILIGLAFKILLG